MFAIGLGGGVAAAEESDRTLLRAAPQAGPSHVSSLAVAACEPPGLQPFGVGAATVLGWRRYPRDHANPSTFDQLFFGGCALLPDSAGIERQALASDWSFRYTAEFFCRGQREEWKFVRSAPDGAQIVERFRFEADCSFYLNDVIRFGGSPVSFVQAVSATSGSQCNAPRLGLWNLELIHTFGDELPVIWNVDADGMPSNPLVVQDVDLVASPSVTNLVSLPDEKTLPFGGTPGFEEPPSAVFRDTVFVEVSSPFCTTSLASSSIEFRFRLQQGSGGHLHQPDAISPQLSSSLGAAEDVITFVPDRSFSVFDPSTGRIVAPVDATTRRALVQFDVGEVSGRERAY